MFYPLRLFVIVSILLTLVSCSQKKTDEVVIYTSVDEPYARPVIDDFQNQTGIHVILVTDTEAAKSVGLAERVRAERDHPQCDVFWSSEVFHTIRLADDGVLADYDSPAAATIPAQFKDKSGRWIANGVRIRELVSTPDLHITKINDLLDPKLKGKVAIARPTAGTTGGHIAALYLALGEEKWTQWITGLKNNEVKLLGGNSIVADNVGHGTLLAGLTDNDDAYSSVSEGGKLNETLPDQDAIGTLAIPIPVSLVKNCPHEQAARKLVEFLISPQVQQKLIAMHFAYVAPSGDLSHIKLMNLTSEDIARATPTAIRKAMNIFEGRE